MRLRAFAMEWLVIFMAPAGRMRLGCSVIDGDKSGTSAVDAKRRSRTIAVAAAVLVCTCLASYFWGDASTSWTQRQLLLNFPIADKSVERHVRVVALNLGREFPTFSQRDAIAREEAARDALKRVLTKLVDSQSRPEVVVLDVYFLVESRHDQGIIAQINALTDRGVRIVGAYPVWAEHRLWPGSFAGVFSSFTAQGFRPADGPWRSIIRVQKNGTSHPALAVHVSGRVADVDDIATKLNLYPMKMQRKDLGLNVGDVVATAITPIPSARVTAQTLLSHEALLEMGHQQLAEAFNAKTIVIGDGSNGSDGPNPYFGARGSYGFISLSTTIACLRDGIILRTFGSESVARGDNQPVKRMMLYSAFAILLAVLTVPRSNVSLLQGALRFAGCVAGLGGIVIASFLMLHVMIDVLPVLCGLSAGVVCHFALKLVLREPSALTRRSN
jgi:hypothetical protein